MSKKSAIETLFGSLYELSKLNKGCFESEPKEEKLPVVLQISEITKDWENPIIEDISADGVNAQIWTDKKSGSRMLVFFRVKEAVNGKRFEDYSFPIDFVLLDGTGINPVELVAAKASNNEMAHAA